MKLNAKNLILDLLLATEDTPLSVRGAISACRLFGLSDNSVRVALARASADGLIEAAGRGTYRLSASALQLAGEVATWRTAEQRIRPWQGGYIAVLTQHLGRTDRAALRKRERALAMLGFASLETGFYLRPDNIDENLNHIRQRLCRLGLEAQALVFYADQFSEQEQTRISQLWNGAALNQQYRQLQQQMADWLAHAPSLEPEVAARESFLLGSKAIRQVVFDPLLPEPWVDVAERHRFVESVHAFDQAGHLIWRKLIEVSLTPTLSHREKEFSE